MGKDFIKKDEVKAAIKGTDRKVREDGSVEEGAEGVVDEAAVVAAPVAAAPAAPTGKQQGPRDREGRDKERRPGGGGQRGPRRPSESDSGLVEKVVAINRVAKTTKGGTRLAFSALVVVGDGKGKVGYCLGKAGEVANAIKKALNGAKRQMVRIPMRGTTITHEIIGECGSAKVLLKPASEGTGVIAAGPIRAICDGAGISNILTKCHRSNNPINVVKATFDGLMRLKSPEEIKVSTES
jgi:small subunit ribosomal protein S5